MVTFDRFANGRAYRGIIDELKEKDMKPMRSDKPFTAGTIRSILRNEIYCGDRHILKSPKIDLFTKKIDTSADYQSYYVDDHHQAIVSKDIWNKVQERLDEKQKLVDQKIYSNTKSHFFMGRIYCGECGEPLARITYGYKGHYRKVWKCKGRTKGNGCKNDVINEDELFEAVTQFLGLEWNGVEQMKPEDYDSIKRIELYEDGALNIVTD